MYSTSVPGVEKRAGAGAGLLESLEIAPVVETTVVASKQVSLASVFLERGDKSIRAIQRHAESEVGVGRCIWCDKHLGQAPHVGGGTIKDAVKSALK